MRGKRGRGHQQVSSTRRRCAASSTNSGVSRIAIAAGIGQRHRHDLAHPAGPRRHQQHLLAEERGLVDRMGDEQDRRAGVLPQPQQFLVEPVAGDLVERAERLVHQQQLGIVDERAGDRDALAHAARQFVGIGLLPARQADQRQQFARLEGAAPLAAAADFERQLDVLERRAPRQQRGVLKDEADVAPRARRLGRRPEHRDLAGGRRQKIRDDPQQGRLAASRGAEKGQEAAARDGQTDLFERRHDAALGGKAHRHVAQSDRGTAIRHGRRIRRDLGHDVHSHHPIFGRSFSVISRIFVVMT